MRRHDRLRPDRGRFYGTASAGPADERRRQVREALLPPNQALLSGIGLIQPRRSTFLPF